jgi:hypothetical protein
VRPLRCCPPSAARVVSCGRRRLTSACEQPYERSLPHAHSSHRAVCVQPPTAVHGTTARWLEETSTRPGTDRSARAVVNPSVCIHTRPRTYGGGGRRRRQVGYAIGQHAVMPKPARGGGSVLFATTGWLLQSLAGGLRDGGDGIRFTHVVLDEVTHTVFC